MESRVLARYNAIERLPIIMKTVRRVSSNLRLFLSEVKLSYYIVHLVVFACFQADLFRPLVLVPWLAVGCHVVINQVPSRGDHAPACGFACCH